ncbi:MAG: tRNA (adenosine(37)-N6)-dimethylallyltransferase MiaA [Pseudomonadota bacterium]|nr:tRNA (adenosine(37)-N6)-dimethylallyltransferase MiaA [Pseudomonadota bacterium]
MAEPLICLTGPTAAGKTEVAVALAESFDVELISVDSALVYRGLCIGAAQPDYPHHLIDIRDPADVYTAANFVGDTLSCIADVRARGRRALLVGGTMMYYRALIEGLSDMPASDPVIRAEIQAEASQVGWPEMHRELSAVDPDTANNLHPNHSQRISRALEVFRQTGTPMSQWQRAYNQEARKAVCLALAPDDRSTLHARIETRFDRMLEAGFVEEVKALFDRGDLHTDLPAIRAVGYRQIWSHLSGKYSLEEARARGIVATRQLAKRQITWLRGWSGLHWIDSEAKNSQEQVKNHLRNYLEAPLS